MASTTGSAPRSYTYADLEAFPDDNVRREIIDGELIVSPSPETRHQRASKRILLHLTDYEKRAGGESFYAPLDVFFADDNVVEPDLLFIRAEHLGQIGGKRIDGPPDLVVEISSPSSRRIDLVRKRALYERFGVPEFWFVDFDEEQVVVFVLGEGGYGESSIKVRGDVLEPAGLPGLSVPVEDALA